MRKKWIRNLHFDGNKVKVQCVFRILLKLFSTNFFDLFKFVQNVLISSD